jgi:hypothetical protein
MTLIALLQARNEERFLPGWLANVGEIVDGIVALDDGSEDSTAAILGSHPKLIELIRNPAGNHWNERENQMALIKAGRRWGASWFLCIDADERVERSFGQEVANLMAQADRRGIDAYSLQLCELWGDRRHYRSDGIWGTKARYRFFRNNVEHRRFDPRPLHRTWMPLEIVASLDRRGTHADFNLYHLKMIMPRDRIARHARYKAIDPEERFQPHGYDYLIDETELQLSRVLLERDFLPSYDPALSEVGG